MTRTRTHSSTDTPADLQSYDYHLPKELIAQYPVSPRDSSRLLVVFRSTQSFSDHRFVDLPSFLKSGDLLVQNNTKVIPARLHSDLGEVLLVIPTGRNCWDAMVRPGKKFRPGRIVTFPDNVRAKVLSDSKIGRILQFESDITGFIQRNGEMPLPPYIERASEPSDRKSYQTIFAVNSGSVAAPTAGLHFTCRVFKDLKERGVSIARLTLHVGPGTFQPVKSTDITQHHLHPEYYRCSPRTWNAVHAARRVIAVGTTTTRSLETIAATNQLEGHTNLFIYPGYLYKIVQGLITNFHLPKSSLLMLVSAFGGYELIREAYQHAVKQKYRFYSYGDAMLIV